MFRSGSPPSQVRGAYRWGLTTSRADTENPHITQGVLTGHRHLQGFEKMELKMEKSEMV